MNIVRTEHVGVQSSRHGGLSDGDNPPPSASIAVKMIVWTLSSFHHVQIYVTLAKNLEKN